MGRIIDATRKFSLQNDADRAFRDVLEHVYGVLQEKGYNPVNQLVGYIISGDPAYIPRHDNARTMIGKIERDELIEELIKYYLRK